ncbi:MAG: hypothetical protein JXJ17_18835 [Anaerolineae bacterium]|nr:hypothetical protein [Anaerolineae bacterium]
MIQFPPLTLTLTDILAVWGAILSTMLAIRQIFIDRRRVKISIKQGRITGYEREILYVGIRNRGHRPVVVESIFIITNATSLIYNDQGWGREFGRPFEGNVRLEDGESRLVLIDREYLKEAIEREGLAYGKPVRPIRVRVIVSGRTYQKIIKWKVQDWIMKPSQNINE